MDNYTQFERDGLTIAVGYDHDSGSPFDWGWEGLAISPYERNSNDYGDTELLSAMEDHDVSLDYMADELDQAHDNFRSALGFYEGSLDGYHAVLNALAELRECVEELEDLEDNRPELVEFEWCPYVDLIRYFRVVYDPTEVRKCWFHEDRRVSDEEVHKFVVGCVETFNTWYRGGVFFITVERDGEQLDSLGGVMFNDECPLDDEIWEFVQSDMIT